MDYRCHDRLVPFFKKPRIIPPPPPKKTNRTARRCICRYNLQAAVGNSQIRNQLAVELQLFTSSLDSDHQWLPNFELNQIRACLVFFFYTSNDSRFTAGKESGVKMNFSSTCGLADTEKTTIFTSIVYGSSVQARPLLCSK
jgi:hypothetical protein